MLKSKGNLRLGKKILESSISCCACLFAGMASRGQQKVDANATRRQLGEANIGKGLLATKGFIIVWILCQLCVLREGKFKPFYATL